MPSECHLVFRYRVGEDSWSIGSAHADAPQPTEPHRDPNTELCYLNLTCPDSGSAKFEKRSLILLGREVHSEPKSKKHPIEVYPCAFEAFTDYARADQSRWCDCDMRALSLRRGYLVHDTCRDALTVGGIADLPEEGHFWLAMKF